MAMPNLRRYDVQARYSITLSVLALLPLFAATAACLKNYGHELRAIQYGQHSVFLFAFLVCIGTAGLLSALGVIFGFNSAGQRRNDATRKSWLGFFIGTAVMSLSIVVFFGFYFLRMPIVTG